MNLFLLTTFTVLFNNPVNDSTIRKDSVIALPDRYLSQVKRKSEHVEAQVDKRTAQALDRFARQEKRMQAKLMKVDSTAAKRIFSQSIDSLKNMKAGLGRKVSGLTSNAGGAYMDTLQNSLKFLQGSNNVLSGGKLASATQSIDNLQNSLQQAEQVKAYLREQRQLLKQQLANYTGFGKELTNLNKEAYYYGQQLNEYKATLSDRKKAEEKALALLKTFPAYNNFIAQHSQFASLFSLIGTSSSNTNLAGLQTRSQVEQLVSQRMGNDPAAQQAVSQQMAQARSQINELKDKYSNLDNAGDMPDFKPNPMKTKSFLQRLEFGGNLQFQKNTSYYPTTTDIAGQVGYKFHKNGTVGVGVSYKLGMGTGWDHIAFTHQGVGLRSFVDWKLKGTFYVNGGFEENYLTAITNVSQLKDLSLWKGSALLGVSKKYKINAKLKGNLMVLYDFLASRSVPATSSFKVRIGYTM
ncbi:GumC domain-containing protein [Chitinophaga sancti]|uniref:Uncharacterized protein n=1 Tax=Chitinophaga sancti TaxID=1004 RepID=A0A1K1MKK6_9BACT|nr:hypothetical protein [Chitinophaga sancti]WQD62763.1 hypothetical protein U0033_00045 [Chitinophaga sancti]WQG91613.1 hypothetical protein SR876_08870 [Chitinophaga sancti]SFW23605.1 hypothetical protein SAMN05661012_00654 [Chitinophaga sancti]